MFKYQARFFVSNILAYDPALRYRYVATKPGTVSVFKAQLDRVSKIAESTVGPNAHVVAVDPNTHKSYIRLRVGESRTVLRIMRAVPTS